MCEIAARISADPDVLPRMSVSEFQCSRSR